MSSASSDDALATPIITFKGINFFTASFADDPAKVEKMKCRDDDLFIATFPKSGTTFTQEITWLVLHDADPKSRQGRNHDERMPEIGVSWMCNKYVPRDEMESPRIFKTHYPWRTLPQEAKEKKCKIIYVSRNLKDVAVSFHYMIKDMTFPKAPAEQYSDARPKPMLTGASSISKVLRAIGEDQVVFGNYFEHNLEYWEQRNSGHVLFLFYEDLVEDLAGGVRRIADFLDKQLSDEQVATIINETTFERMRKNPLSNWEFLSSTGLRPADSVPIMRKGKVGDWRNHFDDEMSDFADALCRKMFEPVNLKHRFE